METTLMLVICFRRESRFWQFVFFTKDSVWSETHELQKIFASCGFLIASVVLVVANHQILPCSWKDQLQLKTIHRLENGPNPPQLLYQRSCPDEFLCLDRSSDLQILFYQLQKPNLPIPDVYTGTVWTNNLKSQVDNLESTGSVPASRDSCNPADLKDEMAALRGKDFHLHCFVSFPMSKTQQKQHWTL